MKKKIEKYLKIANREGMSDLIAYLEEIGFFTAPASGGHHLHKEGGLAEHSLNVCYYANIIAKTLLEKEEYEKIRPSVIVAALLHDVGKCGDHGKKMYVENVLKSGNVSDAKPYKRNPDLLEIDHATRSLCIIERFVDLTEDEEFAIRFHDGLYERANCGVIGHETQLYMIIHTADLWSSHFVEAK